LLIDRSVVIFECGFDFLAGITPNFQKCPQILSRAAAKDAEYRLSSFGLLVDRFGIDGALLAATPFFSDYVVEIIALLHEYGRAASVLCSQESCSGLL
jgi:hypothetical protein